MGNDVVSCRVSIGLFRPRCYTGRFVINVNVLSILQEILFIIYDYLKTNLRILRFITICHTANMHFVFVIALFMLLCSDIEENPGPNTPNMYGTICLLHLNIRSVRNKLKFVFDNLGHHDILCFTETHLDGHRSLFIKQMFRLYTL